MGKSALQHSLPAHDNASIVREKIRDLLRDDQIAKDGKLPTERDLSARFNVNRRAVRRALDALEAEGLIWRRQGKGTFAGIPPHPNDKLAAAIAPETDPISVMEARLAIEPELAVLCARRATAEDVIRLRDLAERTSQSNDADAAELWDGALHRFIARVAGNPILNAAFALINEVRSEQRWQAERASARSPALVAEYTGHHMDIVQAIHDRDEEAARAAMRFHLGVLKVNLEQARAREQE